MIKHLPVKHLHSLNQIDINKIFDNNSTNKINYLNNCLYAPTNNQNKSFYNKTIRINHLPIKAFNKTYNKTFIPYNHFKGFKRDFNYNLYKSIKLMRFWLKGVLEYFKKGMNKIIRLKIYKYSLIKTILLISTNKIFEMMRCFNKIILKMILISSFGWRDILTKKVWSKKPKLSKSARFWGKYESYFRLVKNLYMGQYAEIWGDFQFHFRLRYLN